MQRSLVSECGREWHFLFTLVSICVSYAVKDAQHDKRNAWMSSTLNVFFQLRH